MSENKKEDEVEGKEEINIEDKNRTGLEDEKPATLNEGEDDVKVDKIKEYKTKKDEIKEDTESAAIEDESEENKSEEVATEQESKENKSEEVATGQESEEDEKADTFEDENISDKADTDEVTMVEDSEEDLPESAVKQGVDVIDDMTIEEIEEKPEFKSDLDIPEKHGKYDNLLIPLEDYLTNGIHVGLKYRTSDMRPYIYKVRPDKLCVFDVAMIDERLRVAANFIAQYEPEEVMFVSNRIYGKKPLKRLHDYTGYDVIIKRYVSGTLTNPNIKDYREPKLIMVTDPTADRQVIEEASSVGIPIISICDTNTRAKNIDFMIPGNNKGKNSVGIMYWILAREILKNRGVEKFDATYEDFTSQAEPQVYLLKMQEIQRMQNRKRRKKRGRTSKKAKIKTGRGRRR